MSERVGDFADSGELGLFHSVSVLPRNPLGAVLAVRRACKFLSPSAVHAHSSFAGAYTRVALRAASTRLVYTPHGYGFERRDVAKSGLAMVKLAERALSLNTTLVAACSPREVSLAFLLNKSARVVYVPNVAARAADQFQIHESQRTPEKVVAVGRITAARDPLFFVETIRALKERNFKGEVVWIGGGDSENTAALLNEGVRVTGWLDRESVMRELADAQVHIHTASWDSFPMVLLEANSLRIPSVVRPIPAFSHLSNELKATSPTNMAERILQLISDPVDYQFALSLWDAELKENTLGVQRLRLLEAYGAQ